MSPLQALQAYALARPIAAFVWTSITAVVVQFIYRGYRKRSFFRNKPGPPHSWLLGHLPIMAEMAALFPPNCHPQTYYTEMTRRYKLEGPIYLDLWPIGPASLILQDPEPMELISFGKGVQQHQLAEDFMEPLVGPNVVATVNGPIWKKLHKAILPAFSWGHIRHLTNIMVEESMIFRKTLDKFAASGEPMSLEDQFANVVFDIISRVILNYSLNAQTSGSQDLVDLRQMIKLMEGQTDITVQFNPVAQVKLFFARRKLLARLDPSIRAKIYKRLEHLVDESIVPDKRAHVSILDLILRDHMETSMAEGKSKAEASKLSPADEKLFTTNVKALLLGGSGTTTDSLVYIVLLISSHPEAMAKMRAEQNEIFGEGIQATIDTLTSAPEKLQNLPYTEGVIKEALRLFPIGFGLREAPPGMTIPYKGREYPADQGLGVSLNNQGLHYSPKYFPEPTKFRPERWLDEKNKIPNSYFRTFSRGERACLGVNLAMNELKILLLMTMRDYEFDCCVVKPNAKPRGLHTDLDTIYGDWCFQELGLEAKPRPGMNFKVKKL